MKRILIVALTLCVLIGLLACSNSSVTGKTPPEWFIDSWDISSYEIPDPIALEVGANFWVVKKDKITEGNEYSSMILEVWTPSESNGIHLVTSTETQCILETYADGTSDKVSNVFTKTGTNTAQHQTIVYYKGEITEGSITYLFRHGTAPVSKKVKSISIKTYPEKVSYAVGEKVDTSGMVLMVVYSDDTSDDITEGFTVSPDTLAQEGTQTISVTYGGKTTSYQVEVNNSEVQSIAIKTNPSQLLFYVGDTVDTTGMVLSVTYSDGSKKDITAGYNISPEILTTNGVQKITVRYGGKYTSYYVTVKVKGGENILSPWGSWWANQPNWNPEAIELAPQVTTITFTKNQPSGTPVKEWNADINDAGGIKCYIYGTPGNYNVYLVGAIIKSSQHLGNFFLQGSSHDFKFTSLTTINFGHFDTSAAEDMNRMFEGCSGLLKLDLSSFDTSNVKKMDCMFEGCSSLSELDLSSFDTSAAEDMNRMFEGCSSLSELDLSSFDTSNVADMYSMFEGCSSLTSLDLSNFDTLNVGGMNYNMFSSFGKTGTEVTINPEFKSFFDDTELGEEPWTYTAPVYTKN